MAGQMVRTAVHRITWIRMWQDRCLGPPQLRAVIAFQKVRAGRAEPGLLFLPADTPDQAHMVPVVWSPSNVAAPAWLKDCDSCVAVLSMLITPC